MRKIKEEKGISLVAFVITILVILVIVLAVAVVYLFKNPRIENNIQKQLVANGNLENTNVENTANENSILTAKDKKDLEEAIKKYYILLAKKEVNINKLLTEELGLTIYGVQEPEYAPDNFVEHPNLYKYAWTGIKYSDFRNLIWYLSDEVIKEKFNEFTEYKDYLYAELMEESNKDFSYEIITMTLKDNFQKDDCFYEVKVRNTDTNKEITNTIELARGNGNFVIKAVK